MRFERNMLETRPGRVSVYRFMAKIVSIPPFPGHPSPIQKPKKIHTPHAIVPVATLPLSGFQQKKANGGGSRSGRNGRAESFRAERSARERLEDWQK